ncbi:MAG: leucine-rich repeat domain-containing protein [Ruminococcus sp.]|uniref:leucine-rich repeat domain-containing protein n=1 Tax=Ruminococcus sp. TaxID=41978 RepID=UPI002600AD32|nr:leucine-rich repeat domain-containing protein [Ruminococcus sp.]MCR4795522.1 leucine-rich repeat domain-containing protein [Ruminococcus sp.]
MKKFVLTSLTAAMIIASTGCGKKVSGNEKPSQKETTSASAAEDTIEADSDEELATVRERDIVSSDILDYEIYNGGVIITKYKGKESAVDIPAEIEGTPVREIGFFAFEANEKLTSVALPESVQTIGEGAFIDCTSLTEINLPAGLTVIERGAFAGCTSITEMTIPEGVQSIHNGAFAGCTALTAMTVLSRELKYENWGLEELPNLVIYAPEDSAAAEWAGAMGKYTIY